MPGSAYPRICIDRVVPLDLYPQAESKAAIERYKKWDVGAELRCRFLDGDATQRKRVEEKAHRWEDYAAIKFKFVKSGDAEIRISFSADPGSWSAVGTDALAERYFPKHQPTMNYGWLRADTADAEYARVVLHEFGHALGLIHEHQNPKSKLKWNKAEVYRVFSGAPNFWDKATIDFNILKRYSRSQTNSTEFDPDSIMLYAFPGSLFLDGNGTKSNNHLSNSDKLFIADQYPKAS
jgi:hypothetical protein